MCNDETSDHRMSEMHAKIYRRMESVAEAMGKLCVLDLTKEQVRKGIPGAAINCFLIHRVSPCNYFCSFKDTVAM
jgi:hypothetical protein